MASVPVIDGDTQSHGAMTDATPASPTLQGIPPELRNKIDDLLLAEPRNVSGSKLLKLRRCSGGGDLWKQFQSATAVHPLAVTCHQMRTEFGSALATTPGQTYCLIVDNLDLDQLALFREFVATYCFSHRISDKNFPPLLFTEVVLCLKLDSNILPSVEAYGQAARFQYRCSYGVIPSAFSKVMILHKSSSSVCDDSTSKSKSMTKAQAKLARGSLRRMSDAYDLYEPDLRVMRLLVGHLTEMVDNHWPATSDEIGDAWRSLQHEAMLNNASRYIAPSSIAPRDSAPRYNNAPRHKFPRHNAPRYNAPRSNDSTEPEVDTGMKILPVLLFIIVVGILRLVGE